jgi:hypothetical protein
MSDKSEPVNKQPATLEDANVKKAYCRPALIKMGGLREMTLSNSHGAPDGRPHRGTGRGGDC